MAQVTRRQQRITAMQILYSADLNNETIDKAMLNVSSDVLTDDVRKILVNVQTNLEKIDTIISNNLVNYTISRLNLVDKEIIRIATMELLENTIAKEIIINEALEITKLFSDQGDHKAVSFNNKLLDNISKNI